MEGLLDFGRTRIRKGLRLTGLQESPPEDAIKPISQKKQITKMIRVKSQDKVDDFETTWINPLQEEPVIRKPLLRIYQHYHLSLIAAKNRTSETRNCPQNTFYNDS